MDLRAGPDPGTLVSMDTWSATRRARVERILHSYRILSHDSLAELCDVRSLGGMAAFEHALEDAIEAGRVRPLGDSLYEVVEQPPEQRPEP
jgi:hypothetical protein